MKVRSVIAFCSAVLLSASTLAAGELTDFSCSKRNTLQQLQRVIERELARGGHVNLRGHCRGMLTLRKDVTISGDGNTLLDATGPEAAATALVTVDSARVRLINLTLKGGMGLHCTRAAICLLDNLHIEKSQGDGLSVSGGATLELNDSSINGNAGHGIALSNNANGLLRGAVVSSDNRGDGLRLENLATILAPGSRLTLQGNQGAGIYLRAGSSFDGHEAELVLAANARASLVVDSSHLYLESGKLTGPLRLLGNSHVSLAELVEVSEFSCDPLSQISSARWSCPAGIQE